MDMRWFPAIEWEFKATEFTLSFHFESCVLLSRSHAPSSVQLLWFWPCSKFHNWPHRAAAARLSLSGCQGNLSKKYCADRRQDACMRLAKPINVSKILLSLWDRARVVIFQSRPVCRLVCSHLDEAKLSQWCRDMMVYQLKPHKQDAGFCEKSAHILKVWYVIGLRNGPPHADPFLNWARDQQARGQRRSLLHFRANLTFTSDTHDSDYFISCYSF